MPAIRRKPAAVQAGIILIESSVRVDASRASVDVNRYLLEVAEREELIAGVVGKLSMRDEAFAAKLEALARHPEFVGLRVAGEEKRGIDGGSIELPSQPWSRWLSMGSPLIYGPESPCRRSRCWLTRCSPGLRVAIDHFEPGVGDLLPVPSEYGRAVEALADNPNVFMKTSDIQRKSGPAVGGAWHEVAEEDARVAGAKQAGGHGDGGEADGEGDAGSVDEAREDVASIAVGPQEHEDRLERCGNAELDELLVAGFQENGSVLDDNTFLSRISRCVAVGNGKANFYLGEQYRGENGDLVPNLTSECIAYGSGHGFECSRAIVLNLVGCVPYQIGGYAFCVRNHSNSVLISGCRIFQIPGCEVRVEESDELNPSSNVFCGHTQHGLEVFDCCLGGGFRQALRAELSERADCGFSGGTVWVRWKRIGVLSVRRATGVQQPNMSASASRIRICEI